MVLGWGAVAGSGPGMGPLCIHGPCLSLTISFLYVHQFSTFLFQAKGHEIFHGCPCEGSHTFGQEKGRTWR